MWLYVYQTVLDKRAQEGKGFTYGAIVEIRKTSLRSLAIKNY